MEAFYYLLQAIGPQ